MRSAAMTSANLRLSPHPNDLDRKRIERGLENRKRYRYVSPLVKATAGGYHISSPCCSRNIDPEGGIVDVALLIHEVDTGRWQLYAREHAARRWGLHSIHEKLSDALEEINLDPERVFWQ